MAMGVLLVGVGVGVVGVGTVGRVWRVRLFWGGLPIGFFVARSPISRLDTGWLLVIAGAVLVGSVVLIPALEDLERTRFERDKLLAMDSQGRERIRRQARYLAALERGEEGLVRSLALDQMRLVPQGRTAVLEPPPPGPVDIFAPLEPSPVTLREVRPADSLLARMSRSDRLRPWLLGLGGLMMLVGVLPQGRTREAA